MTDTNSETRMKAHELLKQMRENGVTGAMKPNAISYSTVMNGWAQKGHYEQASDVLRLMYDDYVKGNAAAKPDIIAYNTLLTAYLRSKDKSSWTRASALVAHMKKIANEGVLDVHPDVYSMNTGKCMFACKSLVKNTAFKNVLMLFILPVYQLWHAFRFR